MRSLKEKNRFKFLRDLSLLGVSTVAGIGFMFSYQRLAEASYDMMLVLGFSSVSFFGVTATVCGKRYLQAMAVQNYLVDAQPSYKIRDLSGMERCLLDVPALWSLQEDQVRNMFEADHADDMQYILPPNIY